VPPLAAAVPIPKNALLPLFVIWFALDEAVNYALIALDVSTPTVVATYAAVDNVEPRAIPDGAKLWPVHGVDPCEKMRSAGGDAGILVGAGGFPWRLRLSCLCVKCRGRGIWHPGHNTLEAAAV